MAKINRFTLKQFASNAGVNEISQFGSLAAGSPSFTTNPETIQALQNYLDGWFAGVIGSQSPTIEDFNALFFVITRALAYGFQAGIAEWDDGTTYYENSLCTYNGVIYKSLTDDNLNNTPDDSFQEWASPSLPFLETTQEISGDFTCAANKTTTWPDLTINTGCTLTVPSTSSFISFNEMTVDGTFQVDGSARVI